MRYYRFLFEGSPEFPEPVITETDQFAMTDTDGTTWFYLPLDSEEQAENLLINNPRFLKYEEAELKDYIDWGVQWADHAPDFSDYQLRVDLSKYTCLKNNLKPKLPLLYLNAGPGFGDLSHPTTRLTLEMMASYVKDKVILDIGCGSGILSLAAILLGAKYAYGLDVDSEALLHARENALLNNLSEQVVFLHPDENSFQIPSNSIILMNMIRSQQQQAWSALPQLHLLPATYFTSGVLASEQQLYLQQCTKRGWELIVQKQQGDWLGFHFIRAI